MSGAAFGTGLRYYQRKIHNGKLIAAGNLFTPGRALPLRHPCAPFL